MANDTGGFGLRPVRKRDGSTQWDVQKCYISASYATALFIGDPVLFSPTLAEKDTTGVHHTINASAGTDGIIIWGVVVGFEPDPDNLNRVYSPASTEGYAYVCADPNMLYAVRGDGGGTPSKVFIGENAVLIATAAGSTSTGTSGFELDEGTTTAPSANQSYPLLIEGIWQKEDNELADDAVYLVSLNTKFDATGRVLGVTAA